MSKDRAKVAQRVKELEADRDAGRRTRPDQRWTVAEWLTHWLEEIASPHLKPNTLDGDRVAVRHHLIPGIGAHQLTKLRPEHIERLYLRIAQQKTKRGTPIKPATIHQAHRTLRAALNEAVPPLASSGAGAGGVGAADHRPTGASSEAN